MRAVCQKIPSLTSALVKVSDVAELKIELQKGLSANCKINMFFEEFLPVFGLEKKFVRIFNLFVVLCIMLVT